MDYLVDSIYQFIESIDKILMQSSVVFNVQICRFFKEDLYSFVGSWRAVCRESGMCTVREGGVDAT